MDADPAWGRELLRQLGAEELTGHRLRRVGDGAGCHPMLDWQLVLRPIRFAEARAFIAEHHQYCPPPVAWRFGKSIWNGRQMLGVVTVGNPVARALMGRGIVEVNRRCIRRDVAPLLCWNAASMLYGDAARQAERAGFSRIITYSRQDEDGVSLRAAGWTDEGAAGGRGWHSPSRPRGNRNAFVPKRRWSRTLHPRTPRLAPPAPIATTPLWIGDPADHGACSF